MKRYKCLNCGNTCLVETPPDNSVCGGCKKPNWVLSDNQESYKTEEFTNMDEAKRKLYGEPVSLEELKGHYKVNFMSPEQFIELVKLWHENNKPLPEVEFRATERMYFCCKEYFINKKSESKHHGGGSYTVTVKK